MAKSLNLNNFPFMWNELAKLRVKIENPLSSNQMFGKNENKSMEVWFFSRGELLLLAAVLDIISAADLYICQTDTIYSEKNYFKIILTTMPGDYVNSGHLYIINQVTLHEPLGTVGCICLNHDKWISLCYFSLLWCSASTPFVTTSEIFKTFYNSLKIRDPLSYAAGI